MTPSDARRFLVFVCGHAGTGKTTLARHLIGPLMQRAGQSFCLLDKDTLYGTYSAAALRVAGSDPNDRDSPLFLEHFRDPEYRGLIDTACDNLHVGVSALVIAPLSREVREARLFDRAWLGIDDDVTIRVVWVKTSEATARERIVARGDPNDAYKLAHWDSYRVRRFIPDAEVAARLLVFDNDLPDDEAHAARDALIERIVARD